MLVFESQRLVLLTPPHTASGTISRVSRHWDALLVVGPTPDGAGYDHHTTVVVNGWADFRTAVVARNSCARVVGLWRHHCWWSARQGWPEISLAEFVELVARDDAILSWFYRYSLRRWLGARQFDAVVHLETIEADMSKLLGAPFRLPPNMSMNRPWQVDWRNEFTTVLAKWLEEDFL